MQRRCLKDHLKYQHGIIYDFSRKDMEERLERLIISNSDLEWKDFGRKYGLISTNGSKFLSTNYRKVYEEIPELQKFIQLKESTNFCKIFIFF